MEDRKGDARIYIIYVFFLACTIGGGVFLVLYILQPGLESTSWHAFVGMTLVAIPWVFWFLIYVYRCFCFRHHDVQSVGRQNHDKNIGEPKSPPTTASVSSPLAAKSPVHSPVDGRERRVHFGVVVEMEEGFDGEDAQEHHNEDDVIEKFQHHESTGGESISSSHGMIETRESETPLTFGGKS